MLRSQEQKEFIKLLRTVDHSRHTWQLFSDFCEIASRTLRLPFCPAEGENLKNLYKTYDHDAIVIMDKMFELMVSDLEKGYHDFLGEIFSELELHNKWHGQFFTPWEVCVFMAKISIGEDIEELAKRNLFKVQEPACGAGAMLLALVEYLKELKINYSAKMYFEAQDVDFLACCMAYIQLSLCGLAGAVIWGNTLTMEIRETWYTLVYFINDFPSRLALHKMIETVCGLPYEPVDKQEKLNPESPVMEPELIADKRGQLLFSF
jgi:hypothetical protein